MSWIDFDPIMHASFSSQIQPGDEARLPDVRETWILRTIVYKACIEGQGWAGHVGRTQRLLCKGEVNKSITKHGILSFDL
uniref:Uncharacterized protein n=1 Tax=Kalanchoe fedtschenkoi TaxID=63787 RepID=A0A7N1A7J2_KALFE